MRWIREHKVVAVLMLVLIVSFTLLGVTLRYGQPGGTGILSRLYTTIEGPMIKAGSGIRENLTGFFAYQELMEENERLKAENAELRDEVNRLTLSANELQDLQDLAKALNYDFIKGENDIVTANVVSLDGTNWTNSFTIDKGTESGIEVNDLVLGGEGLVGRIAETDEGWSKIIPIIDEESRISFCIDRNRSLLGIIEGSEDGTLTGFMLDEEAELRDGDVLVTSGMGRYPAGIRIGKVSRSGYDSNKQLITVTVRSNVDFDSLIKVSVIL